MHVRHQWCEVLGSHSQALFGCLPSDDILDLVEGGDPLQCLAAQRGPGLLMGVPELASCMRHAGDLDDRTASVDLGKSAVAVSLQDALEAAQMLLRVRSLPIWRVAIEDRRRVGAAIGASIADIGPQSGFARVTKARFQHRHLSIVAVHPLTGHDVARQRIDQWPHQSRNLADHIGQRGAAQVDVFASVDLSLAVQR